MVFFVFLYFLVLYSTVAGYISRSETSDKSVYMEKKMQSKQDEVLSDKEVALCVTSISINLCPFLFRQLHENLLSADLNKN